MKKWYVAFRDRNLTDDVIKAPNWVIEDGVFAFWRDGEVVGMYPVGVVLFIKRSDDEVVD